MSYFGRWQCPVCKREWVGGIGWKMPSDLDEFLEKICGCSGKRLTDKELEDAKVLSFTTNK